MSQDEDFKAWRPKHEREHAALEARLKDQVAAELASTFEGVKSHVEGALKEGLKPVKEMETKVAKVLEINEKQLSMMEETKEYRIERKVRDDIETKQEAKVKRWIAILTALAALFAALHWLAPLVGK